LTENETTSLQNMQTYIIENGSIADKLRIVNAGYNTDPGMLADVLEQLDQIIGRDGGLPFDLVIQVQSRLQQKSSPY
jgi:hypothetical protein